MPEESLEKPKSIALPVLIQHYDEYSTVYKSLPSKMLGGREFSFKEVPILAIISNNGVISEIADELRDIERLEDVAKIASLIIWRMSPNKGFEVLLVSKRKGDEIQWYVPGGKVENESVFVTATRELKEELPKAAHVHKSLVNGNFKYLFRVLAESPFKQTRRVLDIHTMALQASDSDDTYMVDAELSESRWVTVAEALAIPNLADNVRFTLPFLKLLYLHDTK